MRLLAHFGRKNSDQRHVQDCLRLLAGPGGPGLFAQNCEHMNTNPAFAFILFSIVLLHLIFGVGYLLYKLTKKE